MWKLPISRWVAPASLMTIFGWGSVAWLGLGTIAPEVAKAYTDRQEIVLSRQESESYDNLLRRAEAIARAAAQRSFDSEILITVVSITIIGENAGAIAPIFRLDVSRESWRQQPEVQAGATYFPNSRALLLFDNELTEGEK